MVSSKKQTCAGKLNWGSTQKAKTAKAVINPVSQTPLYCLISETIEIIESGSVKYQSRNTKQILFVFSTTKIFPPHKSERHYVLQQSWLTYSLSQTLYDIKTSAYKTFSVTGINFRPMFHRCHMWLTPVIPQSTRAALSRVNIQKHICLVTTQAVFMINNWSVKLTMPQTLLNCSKMITLDTLPGFFSLFGTIHYLAPCRKLNSHLGKV